MKNPNDLRALKMGESIIDAYLESLVENTYCNVKEICTKAHTSSMTFYNHFKNKEELIKYAINTQLQRFLPIPEKLKPSGIKQLLLYLIKSISAFFITNKKLIGNALEQDKYIDRKFSYIDCLSKSITYYSELEISKELKTTQPIISKIISNWFVNGLLSVLFLLIKINQVIDIKVLIDVIKTLPKLI